MDKGVAAVFTNRWGGVSQAPFKSMNLALHVNDDYNHVMANRTKIMHLLGGTVDQMVCCQQVHGDKVEIVNLQHIGSGAHQYETALPDVDAMVTNAVGIFLITFYADCIPVYIFDPYHRAIGLVHSGWKGTYQNIAVKAVQAMQQAFGSQCDNLEVFIGPGIDKCCFEIQSDLAVKVGHVLQRTDDIILTNSGTITWDLKKTIKLSMLDAGIQEEHILISNLCTSCNTDQFFSYRRENGQTGRMAAIMAIKY